MRLLRVLLLQTAAACALAAAAHGQASPTPSPSPTPTPPPATDIYVTELTTEGGALKLGAPRRVTDWEGYDNQPSFTPDGRAILYTSIRADAQADIYRYDLTAGSAARLTETPEAEYSPTVTPDGKFISVVRVEKDQTQRLWKFPLAGGGQPALMLEQFKPVGYHAWADARTVALFILGKPVTLQIVEVSTGVWGVIATNVGRSLHRVPGTQKVSYVHKLGDDNWQIRQYDVKTHAKETVTKTLPGVEDYAWTPDGRLIMAKGEKIYAWRAGETDWREVADFSGQSFKTITRIAVSPRGDRVAFVALPQPAR